MLKNLLFTFLLAASVAGCTFQDHVVPEPTVREIIKTQVTQRFGGPGNFSVGEITPGKLYVANFDSFDGQMTVVSNLSEILFASEPTNKGLPASLIKKVEGSAIEGGFFHNIARDSTFLSPFSIRAEYLLGGKVYSLVQDQTGSEFTYLSHQYEMTYVLDQLTYLPQKVQDFITARSVPNPTEVEGLSLSQVYKNAIIGNKELRFVSAQVFHLPGQKIQYVTSVSYYGITTLQIIFNENGDVVWVGSFDKLKKFINTIDAADNPHLAYSNFTAGESDYFNNYFASHPMQLYKDFYLDNDLANWRSDYSGVVSYEVHLKHKTTGERWSFKFDENKNIITSTFSFE